MLRHGIRKAAVLGKCWTTKLRWTPVYLRFQLRGHRPAWRIFTHMTWEERLLLYQLGSQQPAGAILLEVGSYLGASTCFLAAAATEVGGQAKVHCVDTWQNEGMTEGVRDTWAEFSANTQPWAAVIVPHRGRSVEVAQSFGQPLNLLFLDGDHSYEACRGDAEAWLPYLEPGSVLIMHDYGWAEGVRRVVHEVVQPRETEKGHVFQNTYWTRL